MVSFLKISGWAKMVWFCTRDHSNLLCILVICRILRLGLQSIRAITTEWMNRFTCSCAYLLGVVLERSERPNSAVRGGGFRQSPCVLGDAVRSRGMRDRDICSLVKSDAASVAFGFSLLAIHKVLATRQGGKGIRYHLGKQRLPYAGTTVCIATLADQALVSPSTS